ncbi:TetR/AcrR family transcriptional regulator [Acidianus manzaensis]|uniref:TetR family transcriptional regulator n=1 Tax=Acidianus manzaensis TaxID=282676 RepID=A0A1W6JZ66_9CREN|nr:TetR/AcrR family transcriptional regulator [Acidianus manzaensis]ARM75525.1 TetR family transcriptional regulator [Acidianus manzaensis]
MVTEPKTKKGKETVRRILEASLETIAEKGFMNTTVEDIAIKANIAYGLFYYYFKDKHEVLSELIKSINRDMRYYLKSNTIDSANRIEIEKKGILKYLEWFNTNKKYHRVIIEAEVHDPQLYQWFFTKLADRYKIGLEEAMKKGEIINVDPELLAYVLIGIGEILGKRYLLWDNSGPNEKIKNDIQYLIDNLLHPR